MYEYAAKLRRVVDGDTLDTIIDLGFRMTTEQRIRLKGIDTPEIWRQSKDSEEYKKGMDAKNFVIQRLEQNQNSFVIRTEKEPGVYGRFIGTILMPDTEESLNDELVRKGYATPYKK